MLPSQLIKGIPEKGGITEKVYSWARGVKFTDDGFTSFDQLLLN